MLENFYEKSYCFDDETDFSVEELEDELYSLADETDYSDEEWGEVFDGIDA